MDTFSIEGLASPRALLLLIVLRELFFTVLQKPPDFFKPFASLPLFSCVLLFLLILIDALIFTSRPPLPLTVPLPFSVVRPLCEVLLLMATVRLLGGEVPKGGDPGFPMGLERLGLRVTGNMVLGLLFGLLLLLLCVKVSTDNFNGETTFCVPEFPSRSVWGRLMGEEGRLESVVEGVEEENLTV